MSKHASPWYSGQRIVPKMEDRASYKVLLVHTLGDGEEHSMRDCFRYLQGEGVLSDNVMTKEV